MKKVNISTFNKPLADRLRPLKLEIFRSRRNYLEDKLLREAIESNIPSMILGSPKQEKQR